MTSTVGRVDAAPVPTSVPPVPTGGLLGAAVLLAVAVVPAVLLLPHDRVSADTTLPFAGWLAVGVAGAVALERGRRWRGVGRVAVAAAFVPLLTVLVAVPTGATSAGALDVEQALWTPLPVWPAALAAVGVSVVGVGGRDGRRWRVWFVVATTAATAAWVVAVATPGTTSRAVAVVALFAVAAVVVTAASGQGPRPVDEPLLDVALVAGAVAAAAASGAGIRLFAQSQVINGADVQGVVAAAVVLGLAVPGALRIRRDALARRYGPGALTDADVAALTSHLGVVDDPRSLLPQAAQMVAAAGGLAEARITLDTPDDDLVGTESGSAPDPGWTAFALVAAGDRVGTLQVRPRSATELETRSLAAISRLLPTLVLVVRAVALALDAQDSRSDLVRQRERERARILQDLHDDLGPALAGMSMRVRAARARTPSELLDTLEAGLAACRADLRRVVAGLTPPVLSTGDAPAALRALVGSFGSDDGPAVVLVGDVPDGIDAEAAVVLYRCVAEGITNAVRHASPRRVEVEVTRTPEGVVVTVQDDGTRSGPVVPGVGLTSLRTRARELGGTLVVDDVGPVGTRLRVTLPERAA
jgi:signal transduction histidine kinase